MKTLVFVMCPHALNIFNAPMFDFYTCYKVRGCKYLHSTVRQWNLRETRQAGWCFSLRRMLYKELKLTTSGINKLHGYVGETHISPFVEGFPIQHIMLHTPVFSITFICNYCTDRTPEHCFFIKLSIKPSDWYFYTLRTTRFNYLTPWKITYQNYA